MNTAHIREPLPAGRRYDLDWLRVLAILMIFIFHAGRFFDTRDWHIKNATQHDAVMFWTAFVASWIMPLIFVVSAASTFYALGTRGAGVFVKDRALRLLVPLAVGVFTHVVLQEYLDQLTHAEFSGSFWAFYAPHFASVLGADGGINGMRLWRLARGLHLWYLIILFVFSVGFLPLLAWLRSDAGRRVYQRVGDVLALPGVVYLLAIPLLGALALARPDSLLLDPNPYANWNLLAYAQFFLYGFVIATHAAVRRAVERSRWISLGVGALTAAGLIAAFAGAIRLPGELQLLVTGVFFVLNGWLWVLATLGFASWYLTRTAPLLSYANEAVLPFYVLHQSALIVIGYFVVGWPIPDPLKFLVIAGGSFGLIMLTYEYLIRRVNVLRFLFGMRPLRRAPQPQVVRGAA
ncbi:MAG: acyltransferase family protein [Chloroflexales bacterium]|nr:acyltransferase family protein [Chloroflexales bacterium]